MAEINKIMVESFKKYYKLKESPIAFFYTNEPPSKVYNPKAKAEDFIPCIIRLINSVRRGRTLVLSKESKNLCPGGLAYLGFREKPKNLKYFLSKGITDSSGIFVMLDGERFAKTPEIAENLINKIPFKESPANYAVFTPLDQLDIKKYTPDLVIFFVNMDQLAGLIQLAHFDVLNSRVIVGKSSGCGSIITEPYAEVRENEIPRPIIGLLTDIFARRNIHKDYATFTIGYERLIQLFNNMEESFLKFKAWKEILKRQ